MNFEGSMFLWLGLLFGVPLLLGLLQLINWLSGRTLVPLWLLLALLVVLPVAGSFYLDAAGVVHTVKVVKKNEVIKYAQGFHESGLWSRHLNVQVEYPPETSLTPYLSLSADAATFDALRVGQSIEVRVLAAGRLFKFGRFANRSTFSMVAGLLPRTPTGEWREATATVEQVSNFTEYVRRTPNSPNPLRWPYQIIRLSFTPPGRTEAVEVVDSIEIGSLAGVAENTVLSITWPEDEPREARLIGARPARPWANWFYLWGEELAMAAACIALILALSLWSRRRKARNPEKPFPA